MSTTPPVYDVEREPSVLKSSAGLETRPLPAPRFRIRILQLIYRIGLLLALLLLGGLFLIDHLASGKINWELGALLLTLAAGFFYGSLVAVELRFLHSGMRSCWFEHRINIYWSVWRGGGVGIGIWLRLLVLARTSVVQRA
jgi:hypothetical protein